MVSKKKIISFFNNKGGVGKTTMVYHLAWTFSEMGKRVLVVDLDPQSNLTAMFLGDKMETLLDRDDSESNTIMFAVRPLLKGIADIAEPKFFKPNSNIGLIAGDLQLSTFEDKLSDSWIKCSDGDESAFRAVSSFYRIVQNAADKFDPDLILLDIGPNLGAINRAALVSSDLIITPVAPDLFSLQGLKNLGPTLKKWKNQWGSRLKENPEPSLNLPKGEMKPGGYIVMQHSMRGSRPVKAYLKWANRIPKVYREFVLNKKSESETSVENDIFCIGLLKNYQSLMPMAMEANKPIFLLKPSDGALGAHLNAVRKSFYDFKKIAVKILEKV